MDFRKSLKYQSYVYWTVHNLDSWIKRDQLDVTFFISLFNAQHISDVNTSILRSLRLIYWVISWIVLLWFDACWCYIVVWLGWCGIRMQAENPPSSSRVVPCARTDKHDEFSRVKVWMFHTLTLLSAAEDFIEFCSCKNFTTYIKHDEVHSRFSQRSEGA